jgi:hypothetical protein
VLQQTASAKKVSFPVATAMSCFLKTKNSRILIIVHLIMPLIVDTTVASLSCVVVLTCSTSGVLLLFNFQQGHILFVHGVVLRNYRGFLNFFFEKGYFPILNVLVLS